MSKFFAADRKIKLLLFLSLIFFSSMSFSRDACVAAFKSISESYLELIESHLTGSDRTVRVSDLLTDALAPMVIEFNDHLDRLDEAAIKRKFIDLKRTAPIYDGVYSNRIAQIPHANSLTHEEPDQSQYLIDLNAEQSSSRYELDNFNLVRTVSKHVYTAYSETRVEDFGRMHRSFATIITPVGEYGHQFSTETLRTTEIMMDLAADEMQDTARNTFINAKKLFFEETARGQTAYSDHSRVVLTPLSGMLEGILSLHQLISLLLSSRIPGVENEGAALRLLIHSGKNKFGLLSRITAQLPMGVVGPSVLSGLTIKNALALDPVSGELVETENFREFIKHVQKKSAADGLTKGVCPMARLLPNFMQSRSQLASGSPHSTGIQLLAESYLRIFEHIHAVDQGR